ncbi:hypothetical protein H0H93_014815, partial [Arthromyces matolae]
MSKDRISLSQADRLLKIVGDTPSRQGAVFAVLIGINNYKDPQVPNLHAAIKDVYAIEDLLVERFSASRSRIIKLLNEEATREGILKAFQDLADNEDIGLLDPILIYYAGHGSKLALSRQTPFPISSSGRGHMLLPHDFKLEGSQSALGQGISDVGLSDYLAKIAASKSNNITVLLDCCFVGLGVRESIDTYTARGVDLPMDYGIPDSHCSGQFTRLNTHTLLTACKESRLAFETENHGLFTDALLKVLRKHDTATLSYSDLATQLALLNLPQSLSPQCEGVHQNRIIFTCESTASGVQPIQYGIYAVPKKPDTYILEAGLVHGVVNGDEFTLYLDKNLSLVIGAMVTRDIGLFETGCTIVYRNGRLPRKSQASIYAVQTLSRAGKPSFRLYVDSSDPVYSIFKKIVDNWNDDNSSAILLAGSDSANADLAIHSTSEGLIQFEVKDTACRQHGLMHMPFSDVGTEDSDRLTSILRSASRFYRYLDARRLGLAVPPQITVECFKVIPSFRQTWIPEPEGQNLNVDGTIFIELRDSGRRKDAYGYRINNTSSTQLYATVFYFDMSDFGIVPYCVPTLKPRSDLPPPREDEAWNAAVTLPANGALTIGFGDSVCPPRTYALQKNQEVDVGFLKVYLSQEYVDYSYITQSSPFQPPFRSENTSLDLLSEVERNFLKRSPAIIIPI